MHQPQHSNLYNAVLAVVIFMLFQKGNRSHSPPQSAKSKFGSNLPFVWNDSGTVSWIFSDPEEDQPERSGSHIVALRIRALCRLDMYYWTGVVRCFTDLCSEWMMNYPFHCSLICIPVLTWFIQKVWTNLCPQQSSYRGSSLSCAYNACNHWIFVLCGVPVVCTIHNNKGVICRYTSFLVANPKQLFKIK